MNRIVSIIVFLSISLFAEKMTFETTKNEYIQLENNNGIFNFINLKYHNKDTLLFFFGSNCPVCAGEMNDIKRLAREGNIKIIGIHGQDFIGDPALKAFIKKEKINFDVLSFKNDIKLINYMKERGFWISEVPLHVLVDKKGNLKVVKFSDIINNY
jgi:peroxiredoxin